MVLPDNFARSMLDSVVKARNGTGDPTGADSAALRAALPDMIARMTGGPARGPRRRTGPTQCHDITLYPAIGLAGGACEGYGLLLDISDPANPKRLAAVADSNFSYWHSATFNNDGTKMLFSDEWGGGGQPKCRATDKKEWGANAIFTRNGSELSFASYYKMPAAQTPQENCVAHNGSLIPIPGRDVMVQSWYQGGISVFDWTDAAHPVEIAFHDRGPVDSTRMGSGGSWSVYWYNGVMVSSEISRGPGHLRAHAERVPQPERDRRGPVGASGLPERPGPAETGVAAELRAGAGLPRPAGAVEGTGGGEDRRGPHGARERRTGRRRRAARSADRAGHTARGRRGTGRRRRQGAAARASGRGSGRRVVPILTRAAALMTPQTVRVAVIAAVALLAVWFMTQVYTTAAARECLAGYRAARSAADTARVDAMIPPSGRSAGPEAHSCRFIRVRWR